MYTLLRTIPPSVLLAQHLPTFSASLLLAELFYKFGSFAIECLAFLATWVVLDTLWGKLAGRSRVAPRGEGGAQR